MRFMRKKTSNNNLFLFFVTVFFVAISIDVAFFHTRGSGSFHHVKQDDYELILAGKNDRDIASGNTSAISKHKTAPRRQSGSADAKGDYRHENNAFRKIMERSASFQESCRQLPEHHLGEPPVKAFDTGVPPLPEHGVHEAMKQWLNNEATGANDIVRGDYPMCRLPPSKSCEVEKFTVILMSHTVTDDERLKKLKNGIRGLSHWKNTGEIILVWNSPKSVLVDCEKENCKGIMAWNADSSHPLRIYFSLDNGLQNNLLNRYHPTLEPKHEAIVYFDDDGPFHSEDAMKVGFELWKFNSDRQIGSMARNIRYPSKRMDDLQNEASDLASKLYNEDAWQTHVHPYDTKTVERMMKEQALDKSGYPQFTPICHEQSGDVVEYNYFVFPQFKAHMSLPSGSILHRNYLCFVWHPAFEELRQFILDHPTHPDDMTISTMVSHLSGKPPRTFPRKIKRNPPSEEVEVNGKRRLREVLQQDFEVFEQDFDELVVNKEVQSHRRLLWQQRDWGDMREEAIDSIVGYFGSINPGSVGWCVGTEYQKVAKGKGNMRYNCISKHNPPPFLNQIPWMNEGGLGHDECH